MRSKTPLALMEQVVMVLVFALAAALCLRVFAFSNQMSRRNANVDRAVLEAQNAAEIIKSGGGMDALKETLGAREADGGRLAVDYDENWLPLSGEPGVYRLWAQERKTDLPGLGRAEITVDGEEGQDVLFSLFVVWQEVGGNG